MADWLEVVEGDGFKAELLKRYPHERAIAIQVANERDQAITQALASEVGGGKVRGSTWTGWADAVLRNSLWSFKGKDYLTGEDTTDVGKADPEAVDALTLKAIELYMIWYRDTQPAPKGSSETDSPTLTSEKAPSPDETSASA